MASFMSSTQSFRPYISHSIMSNLHFCFGGNQPQSSRTTKKGGRKTGNKVSGVSTLKSISSRFAWIRVLPDEAFKGGSASFASYLLRPRIYTKFHFMKAVASSFVFLYLHGAERLCPFFLLLSVKLFAFELPSGGVLFISFGKYVWSFWHRSRLSSLLVNPLLYTVHETQKIPDKILFWEPSTALLCCRHCCGLVVVEALHYTSHTNSGSQNHISRMSGSVVVATRRQTRQ